MANLVEEIVLLAYDDDKGVNNSGSDLDLGMAGAALMDLALHGRIKVSQERVVVVDERPIGNKVLDEILERLKTSKPRSPTDWGQKIYHGLAKKVRDDMVERDLLRAEQSKALKVFRYTRYLPTDPTVEREVRQRLENAARLGRADSNRTAALAGAIRALRIEKTALPDMPWGKARAALEAVSDNCDDDDVDASIRATREAINAFLTSIATMLGASIAIGTLSGNN